MERISATVSLRAFRSRLSAAKRRTGLLYGSSVAALADDLRAALLELKESLDDPRKGVEAVADLFRSDEALFNKCDDSYGFLGQVFTFDACELFVHYAAACEEKEWLAELMLELQMDSNYGVRDCLIDVASRFLSVPAMRASLDRLWTLVHDASDVYRQRHWLYRIESLARQMHDPQMFERATLAVSPDPGIGQCLDIAEVYFESGDAKTALDWLKKVPLEAQYEARKRDALLLSVYQKLARRKEAVETAWRIFRRWRHEETFSQLLDIIGSQDREQLLNDEAKLILKSAELSYTDAKFLIWCGKVEDAETYLLSHTAEIDGNYYGDVLPLAETMEREERYLAATVLYRALLESILARAISKYYGYGVRYLRKLGELAPSVLTWKKFTPHDKYFSQLVEKHKRKSSFWGKYEAKGRREERG